MRYILPWFSLILFLPVAAQDSAQYRWPLDFYDGFSSAFGEYRFNHFHAGVDLKTFKETGYPVRAIADGEVQEIRVAKFDTGRAIYLKQHDGRMSIYYHLSHFVESLERVVASVRESTGEKYFGNHRLSQPIAFKAGEVIAFSGETGAGFAHLHLEIRDESRTALNPFQLVAFPRPDPFPPVLKEILVRSYGNSQVNGRIGESRVTLTLQDQVYRPDQPLLINGPVEFILKAFDLSDGAKRVSPHSLEAYLDDRLFFKISFDRLIRDDNNQIGFVYDCFHSTPGSYFFNLFFQPGFELEKKKITPTDLFRALAEGLHELRVVVRDHFNNSATALIPFKKVVMPTLSLKGIVANDRGYGISFHDLNWASADQLRITLRDAAGQSLAEQPIDVAVDVSQGECFLASESGAIPYYLDFDFYSGGILFYRKRIILDEQTIILPRDIAFSTFINRDDIFVCLQDSKLGVSNFQLKIFQAGDSRIIPASESLEGPYFHFKPLNRDHCLQLRLMVIKEGVFREEISQTLQIIGLDGQLDEEYKFKDFQADFQARSVFEPRVLQVKIGDYPTVFPVLSSIIEVTPGRFSFTDRVVFKFAAPLRLRHPEQVGIFRFNHFNRRWYYVPTVWDKETHTFQIRVLVPGVFSLQRDQRPPKVKIRKMIKQRLEDLKELVIRIKDSGKGVDEKSLKVVLNGIVLDCEYDFDWRYVKIENPPGLKKGWNHLQVDVSDLAKNRTISRFSFRLL